MSKSGFATVLSGFRKSAGKQKTVQEKNIDLPKDEIKSVDSFLSGVESLDSLSIGNMDLSCSNLSEAKKKENPKKITERIFKKFITKDNSAELWISKQTGTSKGRIGEEGQKTTSQIVSEVMKKIENMIAKVTASKTDISMREVFNLNQDSYNAIKGAITGHEDPRMKEVKSTLENGVAIFSYAKESQAANKESGGEEEIANAPTNDERKDGDHVSSSDSQNGGLATPDYLESSEDKDFKSPDDRNNNNNNNINNN